MIMLFLNNLIYCYCQISFYIIELINMNRLDRSNNHNNETVDQTNADISVSILTELQFSRTDILSQLQPFSLFLPYEQSIFIGKKDQQIDFQAEITKVTQLLSQQLRKTQYRCSQRIMQAENRVLALEAQLLKVQQKLKILENQASFKNQQKKQQQTKAAIVQQQVRKIQNQYRVWFAGVLLFPETYFTTIKQAISTGIPQQIICLTYEQLRKTSNREQLSKNDILNVLKIVQKNKIESSNKINSQNCQESTSRVSKIQNNLTLLKLVQKTLIAFEVSLQLNQEVLEKVFSAINMVIQNMKKLQQYSGLEIISSIIIKCLFQLNKKDDIVSFHFKLQKVPIMMKRIKQVTNFFEKKK